MKKQIILTIAIIIGLSINAHAGLENWTINGVRMSTIKEHPVSALSGMAVSALVHCAGHHLISNALGHDMGQDGLHEVWDGNISNTDADLINLAGFAVQLTVGSILNEWGNNKSFNAGYNSWSLLEIVTYRPIWGSEQGDLQGHVGDTFNYVFGVWAILNLR